MMHAMSENPPEYVGPKKHDQLLHCKRTNGSLLRHFEDAPLYGALESEAAHQTKHDP
jgi:hypothetical protein